LDALEPYVESITRVNIAGWRGHAGKQLKIFHPGWRELFGMRSHEAPVIKPAELQKIADQLPRQRADMIFAGRVCTAVIVQDLIEQKLVSGDLKIVDFDDIMSKFRMRQVRHAGETLGKQGRLLGRIDARIIARAESRIARSWHSISLCTDEDVGYLRASEPGASVVKVPNVVDRPFLPPRTPDGRFRVLFVGNLSFAPNVQGLGVFADQAWPLLKQAVPEAALDIVGINPDALAIDISRRSGAVLHANVPSLAPFYEQADVVISPVLFGSGTRIKILEAMAFGRAIVSTSIGAEGMDFRHEEHLLLADTMPDFAAALARLARDPLLRDKLAANAYVSQQERFGPPVLYAAVDALVAAGRAHLSRTNLSREQVHITA
jgi:glycosyltransferase involved in cell wall biosynthesis